MMLFTIELDILLEKVVLHMFFSYNYVKIKVGSYDSLPLEKTLTLRQFKSVFNKIKTIIITIYF